MRDKPLLSDAREVYARYPPSRWPDPTRYNTSEKIVRRMISLQRKCQKLRDTGKHRKANTTLTMAYQRMKLELVVLLSKKSIAYPCLRNQQSTTPIPMSFALLAVSIRVADSVYMSNGQTKEDRAADKKKQLMDILILASQEVKKHIPSSGLISDIPV